MATRLQSAVSWGGAGCGGSGGRTCGRPTRRPGWRRSTPRRRRSSSGRGSWRVRSGGRPEQGPAQDRRSLVRQVPGVCLPSEECTVTSRPACRTAWAEKENRWASPRNAQTIAAIWARTGASSASRLSILRSATATACAPVADSPMSVRAPATRAPSGRTTGRPGRGRPGGTAWRASAEPRRHAPRPGPGELQQHPPLADLPGRDPRHWHPTISHSMRR